MSPKLGVDGAAGAFGVNYALRPHKFVDRRVFVEVISRCANLAPIHEHVYVGLGSFAMEDHKLINASFGTTKLLSLEIDADVILRQKFNAPLACITPTAYSTEDFVAIKDLIYREIRVAPDSKSIVWFDMTDAATLRSHLDTFRLLLSKSEPGDIVRMTVDVDEKTLARKSEGEDFDDLQRRRFSILRDYLGPELKPGAEWSDLNVELGIAKLVCSAFELAAEQAFELNRVHQFSPISLTTYADGHRMLSITGIIVERSKVIESREKMDLSSVPGGVTGWAELVSIQIPQLTSWEKMMIDRQVHNKTGEELSVELNFKLHESISTIELLDGYKKFQRFYPTFRSVIL